MKTKLFVPTTIMVVLISLCVSAQENDRPVTFTDHLKQSITISRFGTVLSFTNSSGKQISPSHTFRVCPCGNKGRCVESNAPIEGTKATLEVEFPQPGATLKQGQALIVAATVSLDEMTLKRRLAWMAGSSIVDMIEVVPESSAAICSFDERSKVLTGGMCPVPPRESHSQCPPPALLIEFKESRDWRLFRRVSLDLAKIPG